MVAAFNDPSLIQYHDHIGILIVDKRWAITNVVRPLISLSIPSCTIFSVRESMELVASSRINTGALANAARAMDNNWRCP